MTISDVSSRMSIFLKRLFDIFLALSMLIVCIPLLLSCSWLVWHEHDGSVFFKQERIGRYGKPFMMYKFRSMKMDAEYQGPALYQPGKDTRLTMAGAFLRAHHLDELPQLWNILCGDMSFVGPRPERQFYIDRIMIRDPRYAQLYAIRPGVTSYATLYNGYTDTMEKMLMRLKWDLYYLHHRSWRLDFHILSTTFRYMLVGKKF